MNRVKNCLSKSKNCLKSYVIEDFLYEHQPDDSYKPVFKTLVSTAVIFTFGSYLWFTGIQFCPMATPEICVANMLDYLVMGIFKLLLFDNLVCFFFFRAIKIAVNKFYRQWCGGSSPSQISQNSKIGFEKVDSEGESIELETIEGTEHQIEDCEDVDKNVEDIECEDQTVSI